MGCIMEFNGAEFQIESSLDSNKQKMMIEMLLHYSEIDIKKLAFLLAVPVDNIQSVCDGHCVLVDDQAENLAQIFLRFFGRTFFQKFSIIRNFANHRS